MIIVSSSLLLLCLVINAVDRGISEHKKKRWNQLVVEKSYKLKSLHELNQLWSFSEVKQQFVFRKQFSSHDQFEQYNLDMLFHSVVGLQTSDFLKQLERIRANEEKYRNYQTVLKHQIVDTPEEKVKEWGIPKKYYYTYENLLYEEELLTPDTDFTVRILLQCNENTREKIYSSQDVKNRINQIWKYKVKASSEKLKALSRLNYQTSQRICSLEPVYEYSKFCDSLSEFKKYDYSDSFIKEKIQEEYALLSQRIQQARQNKAIYDEYLIGFYGLLPTDQKVIAESRIPDKAYAFYEQQLSEEQKLAAPVTNFKCKITVMYISPKGRNQNIYERTYSFNDILWLHQRVKNEWNNKQQYQQSKEYERSRMTNSLRYDVMKRDGFRCVLCGASQVDGAKLHVDHIKPIAKGGKTEMSNLRTLCDRCNSGKRDKYDPLGVN